MSGASSFVRLVRGLRVALLGVPHRHRWETIRETTIVEEVGGPAIGRAYDLRCSGCGQIKRVKL